MLVVEAGHMGMCFGVRDALTMMRGLDDPNRVTVHGELVHNPVITKELTRRGFHQQTENDRERSPQTPEVLITAHGVSNRRKAEFVEAGYQVHDTTCPLVKRAHKVALHYHNRGYFIVLIGKAGHVEVEGLAGDLERVVIVSGNEKLDFPHQTKIAVVNQTTTRPDELARIHQKIKEQNPEAEIQLVDTTCRPTKDRQESVEQLLTRVQGLVVVGGPNSNNTRQLGLRAEEKGVPWWHVSDASELQESWFENMSVIGLTAGTSTTDETIREVARRLRQMSKSRRRAS